MFKRYAGCLLVVCAVGISAIGATPALAASPWWHVTSESRPSYLPANEHQVAGKNEVQEINVKATGGEVTVIEPISLEEVFAGKIELGELRKAQFPYNASPAAVQVALEGVYGSGNVAVSSGASGSTSYMVTFQGAESNQPLALMNTEFSPFFSGLEGEATSTEVTHGAYDAPAGQLVVTADNLGDASTSGEVKLADKLPPGLRAVSAEAIVYEGTGGPTNTPTECEVGKEAGGYIKCSMPPGTHEAGDEEDVTVPNDVIQYGLIEVRISVLTEPDAKICEPNTDGCEHNEVQITGGGAPSVSISRPVTVSEKPTPFGLETYEVTPEEEGGTPTTQAGKHPYQVTGTLTLNEVHGEEEQRNGNIFPAALPKDIAGMLPPGLIGNPVPFLKCTLAQFFSRSCPQGSILGVAMISYEISLGSQYSYQIADAPIVNLEPSHGEAARFGFLLPATPVFLDVRVRTGGDYGVTLSSSDITELAGFLSYRLMFWGVPGEVSHDTTRGEACLKRRLLLSEADPIEAERTIREEGLVACKPLGEQSPPPFLSMPTSCTGQLHTSAETDSWESALPEGKRLIVPETQPMQATDGCNRLPFEPEIRATPDGTEASTPTGLNVDVHVPQSAVLNGKSLAESNVKKITVALPEGVAINPAGGGGLEACSEHLVGYEGVKAFETSPTVHLPAFSSRVPGSFGSNEPFEPGLNFCANASKVGTVRVKTPFLANPLEGAVYLAGQESNPFGSLVAMYVVAEDPESGVLVKLAGQIHLSETGQLVATFDNSPQAAFEDAELHFFGGERAPLTSPSRCGSYVTSASFVPWSAESSDEAAVAVPASSTFNVTSGPHGASCPGASLPFNPSLTAGTTSIQAGGYTPFEMTMSRHDGDQNLQAIELHMPPGLSGTLSTVKLCGEAQADEGTCGPESLIGETIVSVGVGGDPFSVTGGKVYITGPYEGAPFGLSIVNPAKAGPFDLENTEAKHPACDCLVVRAKIQVNPITAALTITSDNAGPYKIPTALEGIPLEIQHVNVTINRPGFTFNPTNCSKLAITGSLFSTEGGKADLSVPFQATNCAVLSFQPHVSASTSGKTSRSEGASLHVKLSYTAGPYDTNIARFKIDLPKQLPSRLSTLQKACRAATFETNPADCPAASKIGAAHATTPLIPVPLEGPMYFVSHGGAQFPEVIVVLQGYGVTIDLHGETFISHAGVTSSTFSTVPDAPVGTFEATLPEGPDSALAAIGNLCKSNLVMPTEIVAQNGAVLKPATPVEVTGCKAGAAIKHHTIKHHKVKRSKHKHKKHH